MSILYYLSSALKVRQQLSLCISHIKKAHTHVHTGRQNRLPYYVRSLPICLASSSFASVSLAKLRIYLTDILGISSRYFSAQLRLELLKMQQRYMQLWFHNHSEKSTYAINIYDYQYSNAQVHTLDTTFRQNSLNLIMVCQSYFVK